MPYLIGNWKMNRGGIDDAVRLARDIAAQKPPVESVSCVVCPPHTALHAVAAELKGSGIGVGAQNVHHLPSGAHTGEVSAAMIAPAASFAVLGHSERRAQLGETDAQVALKAAAAAQAGITPVICVGEDLATRRAGNAEQSVAQQLRRSMDGFKQWPPLIVAYEPVWAIGSGLTPDTDQIGAACQELRRAALDIGGGSTAPPVLYGGSVGPANAAQLYAAPAVDGFLVGGSSLDAAQFAAIARAVAAAPPKP